MAKSISETSLKVTVDGANVPMDVAQINRALDRISTTPIENLRDTSTEATAKIDAAFGNTVLKLERLKRQLADTGGLNARLFKGVEADLRRFENLDYNSSGVAKARAALEGVRTSSQSPSQRLAEQERQRGEALAAEQKRAGEEDRQRAEKLAADRAKLVDDPTSPAAIAAARTRQYGPEKAAALEAVDEEVAANRQLQAQKERAVTDLRSKEVAAEKARRQDLAEQLAAARQLEAQKTRALDDEKKRIAEVAATRKRLLGQIAGKTLGALGVQLPEQAAGALGAVAAGVGGALAVGQAGANVRDAQRSTGVSGNAVGNAATGVQQVGLVRQITDAAGETVATLGGLLGSAFGQVDESFGDAVSGYFEDFSPSKLKAEQDALNQSAAVYERLRVEARDAATAEAKSLRDGAAVLKSIENRGKRMTLGGDEGRRFDVNADARGQIDAIESRRLDVNADAERNVEAIIRQFDSETKNLKATIAGRPGSKEAEEAKTQLGGLETQRDRRIDQERQRQRTADAQASEQKSAVQANADTAVAIIDKRREDTAGVMDAMKSIEQATRTLSADPLGALRKNFEELKPSAENLAAFLGKLGDNAVAQVKLEGEMIGLNARDQRIKALVDAVGAGSPAVVKLKAELDANDAKRQLAEMAKSAIEVKATIRVADARTARERIAAQVEAESDQDKANGGNGFDKERKQKRFDELNGVRISDEARETREAAKTPQMRRDEGVERLREQFGAGKLDVRELQAGLGATMKDFADAVRAPRPEMLTRGSAQADQFLAVGSGAVIDASNPELATAKESKALLERIVALLSEKPKDKPRPLS